MSNLGAYQTMVVEAHKLGGPKKYIEQHENLGLVTGFGLAAALFSTALLVVQITIENALTKKYNVEQAND